jgi:C1A family cysteine protease
MESFEFEDIITEVGKKNLWKAKEYDFLKVSKGELPKRLGVIIDNEDLKQLRAKSKPDIIKVLADFKGVKSKEGLYYVDTKLLDIFRDWIVPLPVRVDWRNRNGKNNVTPVKDQDGCGSCVAFSMIGTLESMLIIEHNVALDLSEAELQFCGGGSCSGWWPSNAVTYLKANGVSHESCFPYTAQDVACNSCSERDGQAIQITNDMVVNSIDQRKTYLRYIGPMTCVFEVFADFYTYSGGIYSHITGSSMGFHAVEVIGYYDGLPPTSLGGCWICKNSWGTGWGESGFFRIGYGQCGIDSTYPFWGIGGTKWFST